MQRRTSILAFVLLAILLWAVAYPNAAVVIQSFGHGLGYWREFAESPADREALWTSLWISVASVVASMAIGLPLAFLLTRAEFRGRRVLQAAATLPAALPPLVGVIAFLFLYGESGVVTRAVQAVFGLRDAPWTLSGGGSIVFVHAYTMYVYVYYFFGGGGGGCAVGVGRRVVDRVRARVHDLRVRLSLCGGGARAGGWVAGRGSDRAR